jgi:hypothetical protein
MHPDIKNASKTGIEELTKSLIFLFIQRVLQLTGKQNKTLHERFIFSPG